jgi:sialidase-1
VIYSDDHGANWQQGGRLDRGINECEVLETSDGSLYMTSRSADRSKHHRISSWSRDVGDTWSKPVYVEELHDPICQASIRRYTDANIHDRDRILFANPASETGDHLTVRISYDECKTWAVSKVLYFCPSAYSDMAIAPDMSICCLYDRGATAAYESIQLAQFNLEWLLDGNDYIERE